MRFPRSTLSVYTITLLMTWLLATPATAATSAAVVTSGGQLLSGAMADGQIGDLILENGEIVVIISALGHITYYGENGGTVIDAGTVVSRIDALGELYTYFDDSWPRQAVYTTLFIHDDGAGGGPAVVRALGHDLDDPAIFVLTDYILADGDRHLTLTTEVLGADILPDFELGDAFFWGSCDKYVPGYGFTVAGTTTQAWLAGWSPEVCYAYGGADGDCWGPHGNDWSDMTVTTATLIPGLPVGYTRYLAVAAGEISAAVAILYEAMGTPTGSLTCHVSSQADDSPLPGALVDVFDGSDLPHLQMIADGTGQSYADLPPGDWRARAGLDGYASAESWLTVDESGNHVLDFILMPIGGVEAIGDTLTVIQRPLVNMPALVLSGQTLEINCDAGPATTGWQAELSCGGWTLPLPIDQAVYDPTAAWWTLSATVPSVPLYDLYDLRVTADGGLDDTTRDAVQVLEFFRDDYYFIHITDPHLPDHTYSHSGGSPADSTEIVDLRAVIADINLINPEFVLITGDYINEGELEDYLGFRVFTKGQRMLYELDVPTFLLPGNHDLGGWIYSPPPDGTSRRDWWRFFGWPRLDAPPPAAPWYTQNYSFDYGPVHYVGMEAYDNYDSWRYEIYGGQSFTSGQLDWLDQDLAAATGSQAQVLFYHYDFRDQLDLSALGVEMALWGHVHGDRGDLQTMPYDIATNNVCNGERSYRLIRVSESSLHPEPTLSAGSTGQNLRVAYDPSNAGLSATVTADITNDHPQRFDLGRLRFVMPSNGGHYAATGGQIIQIDQSGSHDICHVSVDIPASGNRTVTVSTTLTDVPEGGTPAGFRLAHNHPNPFNPSTTIGFELPEPASVTLAVYDLTGRRIKTLVAAERFSAGRHEAVWHGRDETGRAAAAGIYVYRLDTPGFSETRRMTLVK